MKRSLKTLKLDKQIISKLELKNVEGGQTCYCGMDEFGPTNGALFSCPPPGVQCF